MSRITTTLAIFLILSNGAVTMMSAMGLSEDLGVELAPGVEQTTDELVAEMEKGFSPDAGLGDTLFTLFIAGAKIFQIMVEGALALPSMFINLGFPAAVVTAFFAPAYVITTLDIVYMAVGRRTL